MSKRQKIDVDLPNLTPTVTLPRHLGMVLVHVRDSGWEGINSFELSSFGCLNPSGAIYHLKKRGALIATELRDFKDPLGEIHPKVAHYIFYGWRPDAHMPDKAHNIYKDLA